MKPIEDVFRYQDYRRFLAEEYSARKKSVYGFSYRSFAQRVGSTAPNYLKLVTDGQRNLTSEMAARFAQALDLSSEEQSFFCDLVAFNQASTVAERQHRYEALGRHRRYKQAFRLDRAHAKYHAEWYIPAIRELVGTASFQSDPKWIGKKLRPSISAREAESALAVLVELGLVTVDADGHYKQSDPLVSTGDEAPLGHHVVTYHRKMLEQAAAALDHVPRAEREIGSLTLAVSPAEAARLKERLYALRQELLQASLEGPAEERTEVVQINFQLFPLTRLTLLPSGSSEFVSPGPVSSSPVSSGPVSSAQGKPS